MDNMELAYLAGFVDGEGSIAVGVNRRKGKRVWYLRFSVHQVAPRPLQRLQARFGGSIRRNERTGNQRSIYEWVAANQIAASAITALRPYLDVKAEEADVALEFQALALPREDRWRGLSEEDHASRRVLYERMQELKRVTSDWLPDKTVPQRGARSTNGDILKPKPVPKVRHKVAAPVRSTGYDRGKKPERDILAAEYMLNGPNWIAGKYGVSRQTVFNWLDSCGIPRQGRTPASEARRKAASAASWTTEER